MRQATWIFFDCFNTLLDDFDAKGDSAGVRPLAPVVVEAGFWPDDDAFVRAYHAWRDARWQGGTDLREVPLGERLADLLTRHSPQRTPEIPALVTRMLNRFHTHYRLSVRVGPGVREMLTAWQGKVRMGVVSNYLTPEWPEGLLQDFGLRQHFSFVLNSAVFGYKKPHPAIYHQALRLAGNPPVGQVLFIGDHLHNDVLVPRRLGLQARHRCRAGDQPGVQPSTDPHPIRNWLEFRP